MLLAGCTAGNRNVNEDPVVYRNSRYGFTFDLPASWKGYKIIEKKWEGITIGGKRLKNGAVIIIRHPLWTKETPRQDIPVMIFTHDDFKRVQDETMSVSAAPVPPTELGRNRKYIFALPPRYNFAFPEGFEEVSKILEGKPLRGE